jgi:hypothetical protein
MTSSLNRSLKAYETNDPVGVEGTVVTIQSDALRLTLTLVDYYTTAESPSIQGDPARPHLQAFARVQLWSYGLDSRTSRLGAVVAIAGCILVLAHTYVGLVMRTPRKSAAQFMAIALKQERVEKLTTLTEKQMGRERLVVEGDNKICFP